MHHVQAELLIGDACPIHAHVGVICTSNRTRSYRRQRGLLGEARPMEPGPEGDTRALLEARRFWARLIRQVHEVEPLVCANCRASMNVLAVIDHAGGICRALSHLNLWSSGGQSTGPASEGTKPRNRFLGINALEIGHVTILFLRCSE